MTETPQHETHLDAEQLSAFAEGCLPEHERLLVLAHTAECARCREIAFLAQEGAQEPTEEKAPAPEPSRWWGSWGQTWLWGGATALAAFALLLGAFLKNRPGPAREAAPMVAMEREQRSVSSALQAAPVRGLPQKDGPKPVAPAMAAPAALEAKRERIAGLPTAGMPAPLPPQAREPIAVADSVQAQHVEAAAPPAKQMAPRSLAQAAAAAPAAPPAAAPMPQVAGGAMGGFAVGRVENLPLNNRNVAPLIAAKLRAAPMGPLHLRIEHGAGAEDGRARLVGQVLDASGAVIPKAVVRLTPPPAADGKERYLAQTSAEAVTDAAGQFTLPAVPAGQYQAQISAPGFVTAAQPIDLQSRDIAHAETTLTIGAVSEVVEVSAASAEVATENAKLNRGVAKARDENALPSGLLPATTVSSDGRSVVLDTAGTVFARRDGKRWKRVKAPWVGNITKLESAPPGALETNAVKDKKAQSSVFQVTTSAGTVWSSSDGEHWVQR